MEKTFIDTEPGDLADDEVELYCNCHHWVNVFTLVKQLFKQDKKKKIADAFIFGFSHRMTTEQQLTAYFKDKGLYEECKAILFYVLNNLESLESGLHANSVALLLCCPSLWEMEEATKKLQSQLKESNTLHHETSQQVVRSLQAQINALGRRIEAEMKRLNKKQVGELQKECNLVRKEMTENSKEETSRYVAMETKMSKLQASEGVLKTKVKHLEETTKNLQNELKKIQLTEKKRNEEHHNLVAKIEEMQGMLNPRAKR